MPRLEALDSELPQECGIEIRLDLLELLDPDALHSIMSSAKRPVMLTLRSALHGGLCRLSVAERQTLLTKVLSFNPQYLDLEYDLEPVFLHKTLQEYPQTRFVLSYHNVHETPQDLDAIYRQMALYPAEHYKIAAMARSFDDVVRMQACAKRHPRLSTICMGEKSEWTRAVPVKGLQFASAGEATAAGQLPYRDLFEIYRRDSWNESTEVYALIGNPVKHSIGHLFHNALFREKGQNARYLKILLDESDLPSFFAFAKDRGFKGLSVTTPFKEKVLPFLDAIDPEAKQMRSVNTVVFQEGKSYGTNTDGKGALNAMGLFGRKIVILGAGGTARSIAREAKKRGASVTLLNRTEEHARAVADMENCKWGSLDDVPKEYDIIVNATTQGMPIDPEKIIPGAIAMDVTYNPRVTPFLEAALSKNCRIVYGEEMFFHQAMLQRSLWGVG